MKYSQLSNFQKQQYTNYLQTQLQKFSSFMLAQKRENDKYRLLEDAITYQSNIINQMQEKMQLMELYQRQNQDSFEHFSKKINRIDDIEAKIRRLEDRQRFGCDDKNNIKSRMNQKMHQNSNNQEKEADHSIIIEPNYKDCMKIIKRQQAELSDCQDVIRKINPQDVVQRKDLKKMQKRMIKYINEKMEQIESKRYRSRSKSSKSRSARAGQLSIIDNYTIKQSKKAISSFRIEEDVANKSQISTILQSKSTKKSRISQKGTKNKKKSSSKSISKKKKNRSKSRSISKSKSNNKKQSKQRRRNKSRSVQARNRSFSLSDEQVIHSSISRSHSKISKHQRSKSKDSNVSKHSKHTKYSKKMKKSQSKQKSHSNSHDLCKKRPQQIPKLPKRIPQMKKQTVPLRKRKPLQGQRYK